MPHLLSLSIGPVQEFIAAGRKTRDLWFGSWMLSEVSKTAAAAVRDTGAELVFPDPGAVPRAGAPAPARPISVANKVLAIVPDASRRAPAEIAQAARQAAQRQIRNYRDDLLHDLPASTRRAPVDWGLLDGQVEQLLEFFSAWVWYDAAAPGSYVDARAEVERLLGGRKALRDFRPADHLATGGRLALARKPKSSLDPSRESVVADVGRDDRRGLRIKGGEQLDGISLIKRLVEPRRFVSVSRVAIDPFVRRLVHEATASSELARGLTRLQSLARDLQQSPVVERFATTRPDGSDNGLGHYADFPFDTQLFYNDGQQDKDWNDKDPADTAAKGLAQDIHDEVRSIVRRLELGDPPAYFVVLAADGDGMGAAIGAMPGPEEHRQLSAALADFAATAETLVAQRHGALVYSGGDDVLAFLPLDQALACADTLQESFRATVGPRAGGQPVSLSVGLAIGHYGEHLQDVLKWAHDAEQAAKRYTPPGQTRPVKNALAVALHTRTAGETATVVVESWEAEPVTQRWAHWIEWHRREMIPDGAAYDLRALARELPDEPAEAASLDAIRGAEVRRILDKKWAERGRRKVDEQTRQAIETLIGGSAVTGRKLEQVVNEMMIARHFARARDVAEGRLEPALVGADA